MLEELKLRNLCFLAKVYYLILQHNKVHEFWFVGNCYCKLRKVTHLKQKNHALHERLKIIHIVETALVFDVHKEGHSEYRENKHNQEQ